MYYTLVFAAFLLNKKSQAVFYVIDSGYAVLLSLSVRFLLKNFPFDPRNIFPNQPGIILAYLWSFYSLLAVIIQVPLIASLRYLSSSSDITQADSLEDKAEGKAGKDFLDLFLF